MRYRRYVARHLVDGNGYGFSQVVDQHRGKVLRHLDTRDRRKAVRMAAALNEAADRAEARAALRGE